MFYMSAVQRLVVALAIVAALWGASLCAML